LQARPDRSQGDMEQAVVVLRKKGVSVAAKKAARVASEGSWPTTFTPAARSACWSRSNCESDFVRPNRGLQELVHDIAMHIAASDPKFVRKEDVTPEDYAREKDIYLAKAIASGKPANIAERWSQA